MFPALAMFLIVGSVLLMFLWEFRPLIETKVFPKIIDLLSVPEEKLSTTPIFLVQSDIDADYRLLARQGEKIVWLGSPRLESTPFKALLRNINESTIVRLILADNADSEKLRGLAKRSDQAVEIIHRPRIHFNMLITDQRLAIGSADIVTNDSTPIQDLTIVSSDRSIIKEAQQYSSAFCEGACEYPKANQVYSLSSTLPRKTKSVFVNTSNGLHDLVHGLLSSAKDSVLLISPHITNDITEYLLNIIPRDVQVKFITNVDWRHWANELSDPEALEVLLSDRVVIDDCPNLQANCIVIDNQAAIVSSQNLTTQSWFSQDEAGIYTRNQDLINSILQRVEDWQPKQRFTMERLETEIAKFDSFLEKETDSSHVPLKTPVEEKAVPTDVDEALAPPLLGFSSLTQPQPLVTTSAAQPETLKPVAVTTGPKWLEDIVYVGKKRTVEYVRACRHQIKRKGSVTIRARGKLIYRAVDVAEQLRMLEELELILNEDSIKIETYYPTGKETKWGGISQIAITLLQKN